MENTILDTRKNIIGTLSITCRFNGMRKAQEFIIYPIKKDQSADQIMIQSDTRIGKIDLSSGNVLMSPPRQGGSYGVHLAFAKVIDKLTDDDLVNLKLSLFQTKGDKVGSSNVFTDNSGAEGVLVV